MDSAQSQTKKRLKCVMMLSLKEMALRRVTVHLSNDCKIPFPIYSDKDWIKWLHINEEKVKYKISKLLFLLPESLRKVMIDKVRPISLEIRKWTECLRKLLGDSVEVGFEVLHWTTAATIDYKKTAEALLDCELLDVEKRYELASLYCLQDYLPLIWEELAEDRKKCFLRRIRDGRFLESCWPRILKGKFSHLNRLWKTSPRNLTSFNQWVFENSANNLNKTAAEYFFRKLTHEEKEASLMRTTLDVLSHPPLEDYSVGLFYDVLCFLLSLMTPKQQKKIIKKHPAHVLVCFCVMFWQDLLLENVSLIWSSLTTRHYDFLFKNIFLIGNSDRFHPESFRKFFITSTLDFKKYFVHGEYELYLGASGTPAYLFLYKLFCNKCRNPVPFFRAEGSKSIACIFRNLNVADRAALVLNPTVLKIFRTIPMYYDEAWRHMAKVCLREAKLSKEDRERLKRHPFLRTLIGELYECDATAERKGQKRKLENCSD